VPYKVSVEKEEGYIRFDLFDRLSESEIDSAMKEVLSIRQEQGLSRILCDQRGLEVSPDDLVAFLTAERFGSLPYAGTKLACIRRQADEERLFDVAVSNRGITIRVFEDEDEAKKWLARSVEGSSPSEGKTA